MEHITTVTCQPSFFLPFSWIGLPTLRIARSRLLLAPVSASYIGLIDETYVLSRMILLIDCSAYRNDGFVGMRISFESQFMSFENI